MNLKKEIRRIFIVSLMIAALFCTSYAKAYTVNNQDAFVSREVIRCGGAFGSWQTLNFVHDLYGNKRNLSDVLEKEEKEYAKWKIKQVNGIYYYKNKRTRIFIDSDKESALDTFCYDKKGKVDLEIIRNKNHSIKKIKILSKKKAKEILKKLNMIGVFLLERKCGNVQSQIG